MSPAPILAACDTLTQNCDTDDPLVDVMLVVVAVAAVAVVLWWRWWSRRGSAPADAKDEREA